MLRWNSHSWINPFAPSTLWLIANYVEKNLFAFAFANKNQLAFAQILSQWFEWELYTGDSNLATPNDYWNRCEENIYTILTSTWLFWLQFFVIVTPYSKMNQSHCSFLYKSTKSISLQSAPENRGNATTTTVEIYIWILGNPCKKSSLHCFEFSKLQPRTKLLRQIRLYSNINATTGDHERCTNCPPPHPRTMLFWPWCLPIQILLSSKQHWKRGRGSPEDRYLSSSVWDFIKDNRKIPACFQFVSSSFVQGCSTYHILLGLTSVRKPWTEIKYINSRHVCRVVMC